MTNNDNGNNLGRLLKQRRVMIPLTLRELATISGTSPSYLGRMERGERFPSASILRK
jgi:transcriptional regulator with XRE-family HTH domain